MGASRGHAHGIRSEFASGSSRKLPRRKQKAYPSFVGRRPSSVSASRCKRSNRANDTHPENLLAIKLTRAGLRFHRNDTQVPGKPDFAFRHHKLAVFCDGDFWHGHRWRSLRAKLAVGSNGAYWVEKILRNRRRDATVNRCLRFRGWYVLRFWESDVKSHPDRIVVAVCEALSRESRDRNSNLD